MPASLQAAESYATLRKEVTTVHWNGQTSESTFHLFVNNTHEPLDLSWGDDHHDAHHGVILPGKNLFVGTYTFHHWRVTSAERGLVATYSGPSANIIIDPHGIVRTELNTPAATSAHRPSASVTAAPGASAGSPLSAPRGQAAAYAALDPIGPGATGVTAESGGLEPSYRQRGEALGMPVWAFDCVPDSAVCRLVAVVRSMLGSCPPAVLQRMVGAGAAFAVFGREQVVSDVPAHRFMRYNAGRCLNTTARGLGGTPAVPVTSCAEENLTMEGDGLYCCQSILVHETGHAVLNLGLDAGEVRAVCDAYRGAVQDQLYPSDCYMLTNEQEYWAVGVESWFESTMREDVNGGVRTRAALRAHDPRLAALLQTAFGDGAWRYHHDCPRPLSWPSHHAYHAHAAVLKAAAGSVANGARLAPGQAAEAGGGVEAGAGAAGVGNGAAKLGSGGSGSSWRERRPGMAGAGGKGTLAVEGKAAEPLGRVTGPRVKAGWNLHAACPCLGPGLPACNRGGCGGLSAACCCLPGRQEAGAWRSMRDGEDCEARGGQHGGVGGGGGGGAGKRGGGGGWRRVALRLLPASCFGLRRDKHCDYDE